MAGSALKRVRQVAQYAPEFIPFCLASETGKPPSGSRWVHQVKYDGYRAQLHWCDGKTVVFSRNGHDWPDSKFAAIMATAEVAADHAVLDGEVTVLRADGRSDYWAFLDELRNPQSQRLVFQAFDILFLNGRDLRPLPLIERKKILHDLLANC